MWGIVHLTSIYLLPLCSIVQYALRLSATTCVGTGKLAARCRTANWESHLGYLILKSGSIGCQDNYWEAKYPVTSHTEYRSWEEDPAIQCSDKGIQENGSRGYCLPSRIRAIFEGAVLEKNTWVKLNCSIWTFKVGGVVLWSKEPLELLKCVEIIARCRYLVRD